MNIGVNRVWMQMETDLPYTEVKFFQARSAESTYRSFTYFLRCSIFSRSVRRS